MTPSIYSPCAQHRSQLVELLALGLSRYAARLLVEHDRVPPLVTHSEICRKVQPRLEASPETVLTVTPGLQTESPNPRSTKWKH
jgi:hypothetical protein